MGIGIYEIFVTLYNNNKFIEKVIDYGGSYE